MASSMGAKLIAEFVGTYLLIFTVGCNVLTGQPVWGGVSIACVLTVMIYALGKSSGGNFNPAVSVALGLANKLEWKEVAIYCVVQIAAGICAGLSFAAMLWKVVNVAPKPGFGWWERRDVCTPPASRASPCPSSTPSRRCPTPSW